jgi:hypothetical protein
MAQALRTLIFLLAGLVGLPVEAAGFKLWAELSPQEQAALAPIAEDWNHLPTLQQERLRKVAQGYAKLSPDKQRVLQSRLVAWARMTPEQRKSARANYQKLITLPVQAQHTVKRRWSEARGVQLSPDATQPASKPE